MLPCVDGATRDSFDVQYHHTPNVDDRAWFRTGVGKNPVTYVRGRNHQFKGRIICKYGRVSHLTCAKIIGRTFKPNWIDSPNAKFMRARRRGGDVAFHGDSGGPVWDDGTKALGIISGRWPPNRSGDLIYMAINYVDAAPIGVDKVQTVR